MPMLLHLFFDICTITMLYCCTRVCHGSGSTLCQAHHQQLTEVERALYINIDVAAKLGDEAEVYMEALQHLSSLLEAKFRTRLES